MSKFVSSISGLPISAASAAYAPTNGADVSSIASSYAESAASGKLDATASSQFITSTAGLATTEYVDSSVSSKLDTTAFSTVSSNFLTSETVTATAGDGTYITSINGLGLSGQGGGTQVVTSTASASYYSAGNKTGISAINGSAIIAMSAGTANIAGNANYASTAYYAQTAYYDANGRALTSIGTATGGGSVTSPSGTILVMNGNEVEGTNSAVVVDQTSMGVTSVLPRRGNAIGPTGMGVLTDGNLNDSGMNLVFMIAGAYYGNDATVIISGRDHDWNLASASGLIVDGDTSANIPLGTVQSQLSASSDYWINLLNSDLSGVKAPGYAVTGVRELAWKSAVDNVTDTVSANSASWGGGGATGDYVETSAINVTIGNSNVASSSSIAIGVSSIAKSVSFAQGSAVSASGTSMAQGNMVSAYNGSLAIGYSSTAKSDGCCIGHYNFGNNTGFAQGRYTTGWSTGFAQGSGVFAYNIGLGQGYNVTASGTSFAQGASLSAINNSFAQGSRLAAINYVTAFGKYNLHMDGDTSTGTSAAFVIGDGTADAARHDLMLVTKDGEITMYSSTADAVGTGIMSSIRAISAATTGGGVDSATVSAIASSYAESAVSSVSSNYAQSADVSATVDLVSTQSANWGGSALALSAGPGVTLTKSGNVLIVSTDETVLYSATAYAPGDTQQSYSLNESPMNFETVRVFAYRPLGNGAPWFGSVDIQIGNLYNYTAVNTSMVMPCAFFATASNIFYEGQYVINNITSTSWEDGSSTQRKTTETAYTTGYYAHIYKVVGINRTANN